MSNEWSLSAVLALAMACTSTSPDAAGGDSGAEHDGARAVTRGDARSIEAAGPILDASCQYPDLGPCMGFVVPKAGSFGNQDGKATSESVLLSGESMCIAFPGASWRDRACAMDALKGFCDLSDESLVEFYPADDPRPSATLSNACVAMGGVWHD
jgi:hypothetical protein